MSTGKQIIIVDDDAKLRASLGMILGRAGYAVILASDGNEAVQKLNQNTFDLMILDLTMPGMGGLALLPLIRHTFSDLPVLVLTADSSLESAQEVFKFGASGYLLKPFNPWEIVERVSATIRSEQLHKQRGELVQELRDLLPEMSSKK
jgi:two-component system, NtrC family, response regulator PilR